MIDLSDQSVGVVLGVGGYPSRAPFGPPEHYPEAPYPAAQDPGNHVYPAIREALRLLRMDASRYGSPEWNPMGELVSPGDRVLIKPNFVLDRNYGTGPIEAVITHGSALRAIADYTILALKGRGQLLIADAPQMNCKWDRLLTQCGIGLVAEHLATVCKSQGIEFHFRDLRQEETTYRYGIVWERKQLRSPEGRTVDVDLGDHSLMRGIDVSRLYGADYKRTTTLRAHEANRHVYRIAQEVIEADVVISVPKLKVHSKVGTTLNIKNMVGVNTDKNHLAHYRVGPASKGGDEFSNAAWDDILDRKLMDLLLGHYWNLGKYPFAGWRSLRKIFRKVFPRSVTSFAFGNWSGNDTAWRMALDLNRAVLTADHKGTICQAPQRKYFSFVDGVIGGQGNGPLSPDAFPSGVIIAGADPLSVDWVATRLMGFDPNRIRMYARAPEEFKKIVPSYETGHISIACSDAQWNDLLARRDSMFRFRPSPGWCSSIECYETTASVAEVTQPNPILQ